MTELFTRNGSPFVKLTMTRSRSRQMTDPHPVTDLHTGNPCFAKESPAQLSWRERKE